MVRHLTLSGAAGHYARTPTTTGLDVTNDLDLMVQVRADFLIGSANRALIGRLESASTFALVYSLHVSSGDVLQLDWTTAADVDMSASATVNLSTVLAGKSELAWVRATLDVDNGASGYDVKFWYSRDVTADPDAVSWTQLGATVTVAGVTNIIDARSSALEVGSYNLGAVAWGSPLDIYRGVVRDGIAGTILADFDATAFALGDTDTATANDSTGKTWTLFGAAAVITENPVVAATAESSVNTAGTSHAVTLPIGVNATDLVLILMDIGSTSATLNALTNWTEDLDEATANGLKILRFTGTGTPSAPTFTSSANTRSASIAFRVHGADRATAPQIGSTATGTSTTPDPPSVTPTGGVSKDYLSLALFGGAGEELDDDTWANTPPTNWLPSPPWQKACGTAGTNLGGKIAAAYQQITTGSALDPGTFSQDVSTAWRAQHVLIHPSSVETNSGGSTAEIDAAATGAGRKAADQGTTSTVTATSSGAGRKKADQGVTAGILVTATGAGEVGAIGGGSTATVTAAATGAGRKKADQGVTATVTATASSAGRKAADQGTTSTVTATSSGAGRKKADQGVTAGILVTATGAGHGPTPSGGSTSTVTASATGAGRKKADQGVTATVTATASSAGRKAADQGATSTVTATSSGAGVHHGAGSATALILVTATGFGSAGEIHAAGMTARTRVHAFGYGWHREPAASEWWRWMLRHRAAARTRHALTAHIRRHP